jgi:hypothetical protein
MGHWFADEHKGAWIAFGGVVVTVIGGGIFAVVVHSSESSAGGSNTLAAPSSPGSPTATRSPSVDRVGACLDFEAALKAEGAAAQTVSRQVHVDSSGKRTRLQPGFPAAAASFRRTVARTALAEAAFQRAALSVPTRPTNLETVLADIQDFVNNLEAQVPAGTAKSGDYEALPDRGKVLVEIATDQILPQCH